MTSTKKNTAKPLPQKISPQKSMISALTNKPSLLWSVFIIYSILVIYGVLHHEPWRDEAQAWLEARDNNLPGLFSLLPSEGHPPLWYLLLMPLAKLGLPYSSINWLAAVFTILAVYMLLFHSQLTWPAKLLLPFSYILFYEYSIVGRNYCLLFFFVSAIVALYPLRFEKPLLFALCVVALFNTHILAFAFGFAILALYIFDVLQYKKLKTNTIISIALMAIGGLYLIPYLIMNKDTGMYEEMITDHSKNILNAVSGAFLISGSNILAIIILMAFVLVLCTRTKPFFVFLAGAMGVLYILGYEYNLGFARHFGVLFVVSIASLGISDAYKDDKYNFIKMGKLNPAQMGGWLLVLVILLQLPETWKSYKDDILNDFSGAKAAAAYINVHHLQDNLLVGQQAWAVAAIVPYLPPSKKIYYAECQRYGTYYIFDSCFLKNKWYAPPERAVDESYMTFKDQLADLVFIFNSPLSEKAMPYVDLLYQSPKPPIKKDEAFYIYKFKHQNKSPN